MKVASAERAELKPPKSREETVTGIDGDDVLTDSNAIEIHCTFPSFTPTAP